MNEQDVPCVVVLNDNSCKRTIIFVSVCKCLIIRSVSSTSDFICSKKVDSLPRLIFPYIPLLPITCGLEGILGKVAFATDGRDFRGDSAPPVGPGLEDVVWLLS